jgi:Peptidase S24-like
MKPVAVPSGEPLVELSLPSVEQCAGAIKALARIREEAAATIIEHRAPINLVGADVWFQNSEFAGMPVMQMRGDSMGNAIRDGDFVLLDTDDTDVSEAGIFALLDDSGSLIIKQVELVYEAGHSTGRIRCTPRNPVYSQFELTLGKDARIIGRVAQRITRYL